MDCNDFLSAEKKYFEPILARSKNVHDKDRDMWSKETVRERHERISTEAYNLLKGVVAYGPFKGLRLNKDVWWGKYDLGSQCFGLYEREILNFIENISPNQFNNFIDIGAADGYYAIGMLVSKKVKSAICFESSTKGRETIRINWELNNSIGNISIHGEASLDALVSLDEEIFKSSLILIDIEGAEFTLLRSNVLSRLKQATILIEIHNWVDDFESLYPRLIYECFEFFNIEILENIDRSTCHIPELREFTDDNRLLLTSERRPCLMRFIKLTPKLS